MTRPQAVRRVELRGVTTHDWVGGPPVRPFWKRRSPWGDVVVIALPLVVLIAAVTALGGFGG